MRILYFADIRFPLERANGIQTMQTCYALAQRGHAVQLVVRQDTVRPARDPLAFYGLPSLAGLVIERLRLPGPPALRRAAYLACAARRASASRSGVILTRDLGVASVLVRIPGGRRPPLAYESHGFSPAVGGAMAALLSNGRAASVAKRLRLERRERRVWRRAEGYVTITRALADELSERLGPRKRVSVVPDGVRLEPGRRFEPPEAGGPSLVVYAGHLYPWKGVDVMLRALTLVPEVRGLIIGGHPAERDLRRLQSLSQDLGLGNRVRFTGPVPPAEVAALLRDAHVLVLPNPATALSARYTSPLKLFEYLAAGRPIVASNLPAFREILVDGQNAVLAEPGSPESFARAIRRVIGDPVFGAALASAAFEAASEYTWARRAERLEAALGEIVK